MKKYAVIVAGGSGTRLGAPIPKQFLVLNGYPVLWWSTKAFHDEDKETVIILVLPEKYIHEWEKILSLLPEESRFHHQIVSGGATRFESVKSGLSVIPDGESLIAVHDAARPLVSVEMIEEGWFTAKEKGTAIPVVPVTDSLRKLTHNGVSVSVDRKDYVAVQTPQVFRSDIIKNAYKSNYQDNFTDDASVVEATGHEISLYKGSVNNMKVTNPGDPEIAAVLMKEMNGEVS